MPADSGLWALTDKGSSALRKATPGLVVTIFMTDKGAALSGHCEDAVGLLEDESCQLMFSSPPIRWYDRRNTGTRTNALMSSGSFVRPKNGPES
jgi:hypothetical protein